MKKIGLIINPIAGMGGTVGLKGTDNVLDEAVSRGAIKDSNRKCILALKEITYDKNEFEIYTSSKEMGENASLSLGFNTKVVYKSESCQTTSNDTINAAKALKECNVDLLVFVGGDGTARDIYNAIGEEIISLGIPAGVKIHSPVYAQSPQKAGQIINLFLERRATFSKEAEVLDIDEDEYRHGNVSTSLHGYLRIPYENRYMQSKKQPTPKTDSESQYSIAVEIIKSMEKDRIYLIGPGSTTRAIMDKLNLKNTLIGVDLIKNFELVKNDLTEQEILDTIQSYPTSIILTPTGGQGFLLGRGNQQISYRVINRVKKENIIVVATKDKISSLNFKPLLVDTGDEKTNKYLEGYVKVIVGFNESIIYKITS